MRASHQKEPKCLKEIKIPDHLIYLEGELFILSEKEFENEKIILMGTRSSLKLLEESKCWLMDGTFYIVPSIFKQLFTIHGAIENQIVPLVFCLMTKKSKKVYNELFFELCRVACDWGINLNPSQIITDFEKTITITAREYFRSALFSGCLFHFGQIIWRQVQANGLVKKYANSCSLCQQPKLKTTTEHCIEV